MADPDQMEEMMSHLSKLSAALAATSVIVLSASAAHATVAVTVPKPTISITPISSSVRPATFAGKPATVQNTVSNWQGPAGAGTQSTSMIYQNGKVVGAISSISKHPATSAPAATTNTSYPATPASHPAAQPQAAKPAPPPAPAKPKVTFTPVEYPAFTDQNGTVKGYYVNGKLVSGLNGPTGGTCSPTIGYQTLGGGGSVSSSPHAGAVTVKAVLCYVKS